MTVVDRLAELGLTLPQAAAPVASYVPAVVAGDLVFTSGQLPFRQGALPETGLVGEGDGFVTPGAAAEYAGICALNALAAAASVLGGPQGLDRIVRIVKVVGFVASQPGFAGQPAVINGASDALVAIFGDAGRHARSAVGVAALPLGAPVEVELIAQFR